MFLINRNAIICSQHTNALIVRMLNMILRYQTIEGPYQNEIHTCHFDRVVLGHLFRQITYIQVFE